MRSRMYGQRLNEKLTEGSGVYFDARQRLAVRKSPYQLIEVYDTSDLGRLLRIDGANMTSTADEFFYHENLVHPAALAHPEPRDVLVIGGGDGGTAEEVLKHATVARCKLCELDAAVVDIARQYFADIHRGALDDPRLDLAIGDGFQYARETAERFDLIYLDLTDPIGPAEALYSQAFYADCKRALRDADGALTLHIGSPFSHPDRVRHSLRDLRAVFRHVSAYFVHIPIYGAVWGFATASDALRLADVDRGTIAARLAGRGVGDRRFFNADTYFAMQTLPEYVVELVNPV